MLITEYDRDMDIAVNRREAWEDGRAEGLAEGEAKGEAKGRTVGRTEGRTEGLAEGLTKGLTEGKAKERNEIAQKMKLMGFSDEQIRAATGI